MDHVNPLAEIRRRAGMSLRELGIAIGLDHRLLCDIENGYPAQLPDRAIAALERVGIAREGLRQEYADWRELKRAATAARLAAGAKGAPVG